jgi:uncharacterized repeat protein (TIGR03803 family)
MPDFELKRTWADGIPPAVARSNMMKNISPMLRGICGLLFLFLFTARADTDWMLNTIAAFRGTNGCICESGLAWGPDGALYGTTTRGGVGFPNEPRHGTVFRVTTNGGLSTLFVFNGTNGSMPSGKLLLASDGNFYGTTQLGGSGYNGNYYSGFGTIFRMTPVGDLTTLAEFEGTNGANPSMKLVQGEDGWIYGGTAGFYFGQPPTNRSPHGLIFRCSTNGVLETIHEFSGLDGSWPVGRLLETNGQFYGTTYEGGDYNYGTAYLLGTNGTLTTLAHFANTNGAYPVSGLSLGTDGELYGTTKNGGQGFGTVYRMGGGGLVMLKAFSSLEADYVSGTLMSGGDGMLYGTAANGGSPQHGQAQVFGSIFRVATNGDVSVALSFNYYNGFSPVAEMLPDGAGGFYGTTASGIAEPTPPSTPQCGTIFHYGPGISPLIKQFRIDTSEIESTLYFDIEALAGVTYGLEMNSDLSPTSWQPVPDSLWGSGYPPVWNASYTNGLLSIQVNGPPVTEQERKFFRAVLLPP